MSKMNTVSKMIIINIFKFFSPTHKIKLYTNLYIMTITNPGAISNSGSKKFTNQIATISKINYFRNLNFESYDDYLTLVWYQNNLGRNPPVINNSPSSDLRYQPVKQHKEKKRKKEKRHRREKKR